MAERGGPRSSGFTLVEVVVVAAIIGMVAIAIAGAFSIIVRTSPANEVRADDSRALLNLTRWLPDDVSSTYTYPYYVTPSRSNGFTPDGSAPECQTESSLPSGGESLLNLSWTETPTTYYVDYFWVRDGVTVDGRQMGKIMRYSCFGTSAGPTSPTEQLRMTGSLGELPGDVVPVAVSPIEPTYLNNSSSSIVGGISFAVQVFDERSNNVRDILELVAVSKNIQGPVLGTDEGGGSGIEPNTEPPVASDLMLEMHAGTTETFDLPVYDYDGTLDRLVITAGPVVTSVGVWEVTPTVQVADPKVTILVPADEPLGGYTIEYEVTDRDGGDFALSDQGTITVTIIDPSETPDPPVAVLPPPPPPPCEADFDDPGAIQPNPVQLRKATGNNPNNDVGQLNDSVAVTITRSGACNPLILRFTPDPTSGTQFFEEFLNSRDLTIPKNVYSWRIGLRPLELVEVVSDGADIVHATLNLSVVAAP